MLMAANGSSYGEREMSARKRDIRRRADASAPERRRWLARAAFFHDEDLLYLKFLIPEGARVLELGCGTGDLLAALKPSFGVGVDFSAGMIAEASKAHPELTFLVGDVEDPAFLRSLPGPFDFVVVVDTLGALEDCQAMFASLHELCTRQTRLVVGHFSHLWYPALKLAEATGMKMPQPPQNVLAPADVRALTVLGDFEAVKNETRVLVPLRLFGLGRLVNRFLAPLPLIRLFCLRHFTVCRSLRRPAEVRSASVVIPARNERGNIEAAVKRIPSFVEQLEIIFVEGHSKDGTWEEIERVAAAYPERNIKTMRQPGTGKGDAVFAGFDVAARGVHHEPVRTSADVLADGAPDPPPRSLRVEPGDPDPSRHPRPRAIPSPLPGAAHCIRAMVRARGLSAERRFSAVELDRRRRRAPLVADRTRARANAGSPHGISNAAGRGESDGERAVNSANGPVPPQPCCPGQATRSAGLDEISRIVSAMGTSLRHQKSKTWMPATSAGMTGEDHYSIRFGHALPNLLLPRR
jgi:SAM-dependent methyltransferase